MRHRFHRRSGLTLIEAAASAALLALALGSIAGVTLSTQAACNEGLSSARLEGKAYRTMEHIAEQLESASAAGIAPQLDVPGQVSNTLTFQQNEGWQPAGIVWGVNRCLEFEYSPTELDNGLDDDGNGLVDEGRVVLVVDAGGPAEKRMTLVNGVCEYLEGEVGDGQNDENQNGLVDEPGLCFARQGDELIVRLSLEQVDADGSRRIVTTGRSVYLKN